jgi:transposase
MNIHKNARTTPQSRALIVHRVLREYWPVSAVAIAFGVSERTVYKWLARYRDEGLAGLTDRRSTAHRRPHAMAPVWLACSIAATVAPAASATWTKDHMPPPSPTSGNLTEPC